VREGFLEILLKTLLRTNPVPIAVPPRPIEHNPDPIYLPNSFRVEVKELTNVRSIEE